MTQIAQTLRIDGEEFDLAQASDEANVLVARLKYLDILAEEKMNMLALLTKAKNAYISDIKAEIIKHKSGVDLSSLFDEE